MQTSPCDSGDHHVRAVATNDIGCFGNRQTPGRFILSDRIVRPAGIQRDADVTSWHVRQITQQPQRLHAWHSLITPAIIIKLRTTILFSQSISDAAPISTSGGLDIRFAPKSTPMRSGATAPRAKSRIVHRLQRRRDTHLNLTTHHLQALAKCLEMLFFCCLVIEVADFTTNAARRADKRKQFHALQTRSAVCDA